MNYLPIYKKYIDAKTKINVLEIKKNNFYELKSYTTIDGIKKNYNATDAPIIFTLFVSRTKDILHCVKVSDIKPFQAKKFFTNLTNENTGELEIKQKPRSLYEKNVSKFPKITMDNYRTYKLTNINSIFLLDFTVDELTQVKEKIEKKELPKPKIKPKEKIPPIRSTKK